MNEEGTEAAATAVVMVKVSERVQSRPLVADRLFLFLIRDAQRGTILFIGHVVKP